MDVDPEVLAWLLAGDVSIQYQVHRDLLGQDRPDLRARIPSEGWGAQILSCVQPDGHWGRGYYQPKWTSTHYTLLDLLDLATPPDVPQVARAVALVVPARVGPDGGIDASVSLGVSDVCVTGMALRFLSAFGVPEPRLTSLVDFVLAEQLPDGGFNCRSNRGVHRSLHSSVHSTVSVMEGLLAVERAGHGYRATQRQQAHDAAAEYLLRHRVFRSERSGEPIRPAFTRLHHPPRWHFDVLRALDHFRDADLAFDERMSDALEVLVRRRRPDGGWLLNAHYPGEVHVEMERAGRPSRWITLKALRVLRRYSCAAAT